MPNPPPPYTRDDVMRQRLQELEELLQTRAAAVARGDQTAVNTLDTTIVASMQHVGDAYATNANNAPADQERVRQWHDMAGRFQAGGAEEREHILMPLAKGLGILIVTPFALAGGIIFAAGSIIYGAGKVVQGLGNLLTGGVFR
jgi:hypothetical protein